MTSQNQQQINFNESKNNREDYVKVVSSIKYSMMVEEILPGTFHDTIKEMYHINGLPQVKFPAYIPPAKINTENINAEIQKLRRSYQTYERKESEKEPQGATGTDSEIEPRKRNRVTPSPKVKRKKKTRRSETEGTENESDMEVGATALPHPPTPGKRNPEFHTLKPVNIEDQEPPLEKSPRDCLNEILQAPKETKNRKLFDKYIHHMKFTFIKTKDTDIKKRDYQEINTLIKQGKLKYIYSNPIYMEADCRVVWEKGYVNIDLIDIRNIPRELFNNISYNGKYVPERRSSVSSQ